MQSASFGQSYEDRDAFDTRFRDASARVTRMRGCEVPETPEQKKWMADFANGELPALLAERAARSTKP
jgi:hypothetical protein